MPAPSLEIVPTGLPIDSELNTALSELPRLQQIMLSNGYVSSADLATASAIGARVDSPLGDILRTYNMISERDLFLAYGQRWSARVLNLDATPPDPRLMRRGMPEFCLKHRVILWRQLGGVVVVATADPEAFWAVQDDMPDEFGRVFMALAPRTQIRRHINSMTGEYLSEMANENCPRRFSARNWARPRSKLHVLTAFFGLIVAVILLPGIAIWVMVVWITVYLFCTNFLRIAALVVQIRARLPHGHKTNEAIPIHVGKTRLPVVSILVPLYQESRVLPHLIEQIRKSDYPKELLEVILILETRDTDTRNALGKIQLPAWITAVTVPTSHLQTKPRAMNYALRFCRGDIIGIYDAEDAPEADQIFRMVRHFAQVDAKVACIQGYLDFYNPQQNWLARCFTIDYAIWFRVLLHGMQKLGLPVPLGGTTVFFRRAALEKLGAWDAHNVTEDADLGFRLARMGYRCDFLPTITYEEANCHPRAWIRQRSRWLKGFAMTWITHMQDPRSLWRDLGPKGFLAFQVVLLGTVANFLMAPLFWSLGLISLGVSLPLPDLLPASIWHVLMLGFLVSELLMMIIGVVALSGPKHWRLIPYLLTMPLYWPLASIAVYKAMYELLMAPFYWDKTTHGISGGKASSEAAP